MNPLVDDLLHQAEALSADDLELLLDRLMRRVVPDPGVDAAWKAEVERRADGMDDGSRPAVQWDDARRRLGL